jgi:hypothetical protein
MNKSLPAVAALAIALVVFAVINAALLSLALFAANWGDQPIAMGVVQIFSLFVGTGTAAVSHVRLARLRVVGEVKFKLIGGVLLVAVIESTAIFVITAGINVIDALFVNTFWTVAVGGFVSLGAVSAVAPLTQKLVDGP